MTPCSVRLAPAAVASPRSLHTPSATAVDDLRRSTPSIGDTPSPSSTAAPDAAADSRTKRRAEQNRCADVRSASGAGSACIVEAFAVSASDQAAVLIRLYLICNQSNQLIPGAPQPVECAAGPCGGLACDSGPRACAGVPIRGTASGSGSRRTRRRAALRSASTGRRLLAKTVSRCCELRLSILRRPHAQSLSGAARSDFLLHKAYVSSPSFVWRRPMLSANWPSKTHKLLTFMTRKFRVKTWLSGTYSGAGVGGAHNGSHAHRPRAALVSGHSRGPARFPHSCEVRRP